MSTSNLVVEFDNDEDRKGNNLVIYAQRWSKDVDGNLTPFTKFKVFIYDLSEILDDETVSLFITVEKESEK
jgi:hypothetical protein